MRSEHLWAVYEAVSAAKYQLCAPVSRALAKEGLFRQPGTVVKDLLKKKLNGNSRKTCIVCARLKRHGL